MLTLPELLVTPLGRALRRRHAGPEWSVLHRVELAAPDRIVVTSESFVDGAVMSERHSAPGRGGNVSPELSWTGVPAEAAQLLFVMEDIDVPLARPGIHTAALFAPSITGFADGALTPDNPHVRYVPARKGRVGYFGPRPVPGHGAHTYGFHVFALDAVVPADAALTSLDDLLPIVAGHVIARGHLDGVQIG